ncbi:hypothetical protein TNCV_3733831 [Trichonephila clavipes]|nr:hypothetical protein TNCV_3733831 [Trichonephila clavipes]
MTDTTLFHVASNLCHTSSTGVAGDRWLPSLPETQNEMFSVTILPQLNFRPVLITVSPYTNHNTIFLQPMNNEMRFLNENPSKYSGDSNASSEVVNEDDSFYVNMTTEDLLQPGHVVKERWKVISRLIPDLATKRLRYNLETKMFIVNSDTTVKKKCSL